jgi:hypothetical protein
MTRRSFVLVCCGLPSLIAVGSGAQPDPITGTWTGDVVPDSGQRFAVTLQLEFDGMRAVSGTISGLPSPADVKSGTFDPKTGALRLPVGQVGSPKVLITLDGSAIKNTASGRVIDSSGEGTFKIARKT